MVFVEMVIEEVPCNFIVDFLRRIFTKIFIWSPCQCAQSHTCQTWLYGLIAPVEFCVGFFQEHYPDLILIVLRKYWFFVMDREEVVYNDALPYAVDEKPYAIDSIRTGLRCLHYALDDYWILTDRSQSAQKIAVPKLPLLNVCGIYTVAKNAITAWLKYLFRPFPFYLLRNPFRSDALFLGREVWILIFLVTVKIILYSHRKILPLDFMSWDFTNVVGDVC